MDNGKQGRPLRMSGHFRLEWLIVVIILVVFWLGPGQALVRGEWQLVIIAAAATALIFVIGTAIQRRLARRAAHLAAQDKEGIDPLPQRIALILVFGFSYAVSTIVPFVLLDSISQQTDWLPIGAGLLVWILFFGTLFWHLRKRTDLGSDDHWRLPAKITAAAMALTGLVGAILNEAIGEFWATLLSSPFVILLAGWFLLLALHLPMLMLKESPLAASRARLSRMVFVAGLLAFNRAEQTAMDTV